MRMNPSTDLLTTQANEDLVEIRGRSIRQSLELNLLTQEEEIKEISDEADEADPTAYMLGMGRSPGTDVTPISILISPSNQNIMRTALLQGSTPPTIATLPQNNNNALRMIESEESKALIYQMDL